MDVISHFHRSPRRWLHSGGAIVGLAACLLGAPSSWAQSFSACDLNQDGAINATDVSLAINMALGTALCSASVEGSKSCSVITVQRVFDAYNGQPCVTYNGHAANLTWTASTTPNVTYNVYRAASASGPFTTPLNSSPISGTAFTDTTVQAGQTYYYVAAAVATNGSQSVVSNPPVQATIPSP
jgi:hypothetical protein